LLKLLQFSDLSIAAELRSVLATNLKLADSTKIVFFFNSIC